MASPGEDIMSTFAHRVSLNPGLSQPGISLRASYSSPSYSLLVRVGPSAVTFQSPSLTTRWRVPSAYSISSCSSNLG